MKSKEQKRIEAAERKADHDKLSTVQKLEKALSRGPETCREAKMLFARLAKELKLPNYTTLVVPPYVKAQ